MKTPLRALFPLVVASGCGIGVVKVDGKVGDGPGADASALPDAGLEILDEDGFSFDSATTGSDGTFSVEAPPGETIYALIAHPEGTVASFTGASGLQPTLTVDDGMLYGVSPALRDTYVGPFAGCPGLALEGGLVFGIVHVFIPGNEPDDSTIVLTATAELLDPVDLEPLDQEACYLDPATGLWSPDVTVTGDTGWYLIGGVDEGHSVLMIEFAISDELFDRAWYDIWMPPDGLVPRFPTYVEFPTF